MRVQIAVDQLKGTMDISKEMGTREKVLVRLCY